MAKEFAAHFYKSQAWKNCREAYAKQCGYLCEECMKQGILKAGVIVHHVIELTPDNIECPEITLDSSNLRLLCRECHAQIHKKAPAKRYTVGVNGEINGVV